MMSIGIFISMPFGFDVLMLLSSFILSSIFLLFVLIPFEITVSSIKSMSKEKHINIANKIIDFEVYFPLIWLPLTLVVSYLLSTEG